MTSVGSRDHPRSRGVYARGLSAPYPHPGSSPLARGLPARGPRHRPALRIIPARAGFTPFGGPGSLRPGDHPRSRGVYDFTWQNSDWMRGSSPLARGLPHAIPGLPDRQRIIPARAGFTAGPRRPGDPHRDHPRSRGVYTCGSLESQRTRTLPDPCCLHCRPRARSAGSP